MLLSDHPLMLDAPLLARIQFSTEHIGPSQETRPGYWMHSTSAAETLTLQPVVRRRQRRGRAAVQRCRCPPGRGGQRRYSSAGGRRSSDQPSPVVRSLIAGYQVTANDGVDALGVLENSIASILC
ncbi:hypothetical protein M8494_04600 [Serratia ureilytica]